MDPWHVDRTWTDRQLRAALGWLREELDHPDRTAHYLMQVAAVVRQCHAKDPGKVKIGDFKLTFVEPGKKMTREQATAYAKAALVARHGKHLRKVEG